MLLKRQHFWLPSLGPAPTRPKRVVYQVQNYRELKSCDSIDRLPFSIKDVKHRHGLFKAYISHPSLRYKPGKTARARSCRLPRTSPLRNLYITTSPRERATGARERESRKGKARERRNREPERRATRGDKRSCMPSPYHSTAASAPRKYPEEDTMQTRIALTAADSVHSLRPGQRRPHRLSRTKSRPQSPGLRPPQTRDPRASPHPRRPLPFFPRTANRLFQSEYPLPSTSPSSSFCAISEYPHIQDTGEGSERGDPEGV